MRVGLLSFFPFPFLFLIFFFCIYFIYTGLQKVGQGWVLVLFDLHLDMNSRNGFYRIVFLRSLTLSLLYFLDERRTWCIPVIYEMIYDLSYNEDHHSWSTRQEIYMIKKKAGGKTNTMQQQDKRPLINPWVLNTYTVHTYTPDKK